MISAGRVLLMPKGDYDPTATYEMLDIVSYNGSSYIAKSTTTGNLPTNTTYWQLSAYGGQASNLAGNFAPLETTEYATRAYATDDIFVDKDSQLVIATTTINIGDEIEIDSNCDVTTMAELLDAIENRYDALDQRNRKLVGINPITIQTDLHLLAPGEYFKKLTNFYVTNAPAGIDQVPTAIFRLTVESGLDESDSSLLLTLRKIEGEIYTQAYDGSVWSDWKKTGDIADVPTYTGATSDTNGVKGLVPSAAAAEKNNYLKGDGTWGSLGTAAAKDSTDVVTENSTALVESGAVFSELAKRDAEIADMNNVLGAKNLLPNNGVGTSTDNGITYTKQSDGSVIANGTATGWAYYNLGYFTLDAGTYILSGKESLSGTKIKLLNADTSADIVLLIDTSEEIEFTLSTKTNIHAMLYVGVDAGTVTNFVFYPMIRLVSIQDDTYEPYSMTNREMTPYVQAISNPNLLDNPWFTVNQRGQSSYTSNNTTVKTVDRWNINANTEKTMNVTDDGVNFPSGMNSFYETLDPALTKKLKGRIITLSVLFSGTPTSNEFFGMIADGHNWITESMCYFINAQNGLATITFELPNYTDTDRYHVWMYIQSNLTIKAVKLELGTVSTLAMDTAPNYATELLKCQRYFVRLKPSTDGYASFSGLGFVFSATGTRAPIDLPVPMRATPTISKNGNIGFVGITSTGVAVLNSADIQSITLFDDVSHWHFMIGLVHATGVSPTVGTLGYIRAMNDASAYIDFSADL